MTNREKIIKVILDWPNGDCPLCHYGGYWGTVNVQTGIRIGDEAAAGKLADAIIEVLK